MTCFLAEEFWCTSRARKTISIQLYIFRCQSLDFYVRRINVVWISRFFLLYIGSGMMNGQNGQKCNQYRHISIFNSSSWKLQPWLLHSRSELTVLCFWMLSWPTSGPEFCVVWLRKKPASEWGSLWGSSLFVLCFESYGLRDVSGAVSK